MRTIYSDSEADDALWGVTMDWVDGTEYIGITDRREGAIVASHQYLESKQYTVTFCVIGKDGDAGCDSQVVAVW